MQNNGMTAVFKKVNSSLLNFKNDVHLNTVCTIGNAYTSKNEGSILHSNYFYCWL